MAELLEALGFNWCHEPQCITKNGKPDFFCTGPAEIWAEVKCLGQTPAQKLSDLLYTWFEKQSQHKVPGACISAFYSPDVTEQDVKKAVQLTRNILKPEIYSKHNHILVTIPNDPDYSKRIEFRLKLDGNKILILSVKAKDNKYGCCYIAPEIWIDENQLVSVRTDDCEWEATASQLGLDMKNLKLGLIVKPCEKLQEILLSGWSEIGDAEQGWPDKNRFLKDAKVAGKQLKNALKYKTAPTILFCVAKSDSPASCAFRRRSLISMLYGFPMLVQSPSNQGQECLSFKHGPEAFWQKAKSTSVSAACYVSNKDLICIFYNPWAKNPLPPGLFECEEIFGPG